MAETRHDHGYGYYVTPGSSSECSYVFIFTGPAISLVVERFIRSGSGVVHFSVHRNVTPAAYEALGHAIEVANAGHTITRMANPIEGYRLLPAQPGRNYRTVCVYADYPINFLIVHFIERYTRGPVDFYIYGRVSEEGYRSLENAIVLEFVLSGQQRYFTIRRHID